MKKLRDLVGYLAHIAVLAMDGIMTFIFLRNLGKLLRNLGIVVAAGLLTSCASVKIPDFDFIKFPEFKKDAENVGDFPKVEDAPQTPKNIRSDDQWDAAAKNITVEGDGMLPPRNSDAKTDAQIKRDMQKLRDEVDAYKKDDPQ